MVSHGNGAEWLLSIDFGMTATAAAMSFGAGETMVELDNAPRMSSMVCWMQAGTGTRGRLLLGEEAENEAIRAPHCVERCLKRRIGQQFILLGSERVKVTDVVAAIVAHVIEAARVAHGGREPTQLRLTHPASWDDRRLFPLREAARAAGFDEPLLIPEPVAAAIYFANDRLRPGDRVAVYDLGGGTLDTAVLRRTERAFEIVGRAGGREDLGGEVFDDRLYRMLGGRLDPELWHALIAGESDSTWQRANLDFKNDVRRAKEWLSKHSEAMVRTPSPGGPDLHVAASDFESLISDDVEGTVDELERTIEAAGCGVDDLCAIYLAGGSSRIPLISRRIEARLGIVPSTSGDPKAAIALGATRAVIGIDRVPAAVSVSRVGQTTETLESAPNIAQNPIDDDVQFTLYRPHTVEPGRWYDLLAFAHKTECFTDQERREIDPLDEVRRRATAQLDTASARYMPTSADSSHALAEGSELTFVPEIDGVEFNPTSRQFQWLEPVHQEDFRMRADRRLDGRRVRGAMSVYLGSVLIAEVTISLRVASGSENRTPLPDQSRPYRKIFISYSHRDQAVVEQVERWASTLGDQFLRDSRDLRAGEVWEDGIAHMIDQADVFQLMWSRNSMASEFVRQEWMYALSLRRNHFIRPTFWEVPMPESPEHDLPPEELRRLHFRYLPTSPDAVSSTAAPSAGQPEGRARRRPAEVQQAPPRAPAPRHDEAPLAPMAPSAPRRASRSVRATVVRNPVVPIALLAVLIVGSLAGLHLGGASRGGAASPVPASPVPASPATRGASPATPAQQPVTTRGLPSGPRQFCEPPAGLRTDGFGINCALARIVFIRYVLTYPAHSLQRTTLLVVRDRHHGVYVFSCVQRRATIACERHGAVVTFPLTAILSYPGAGPVR